MNYKVGDLVKITKDSGVKSELGVVVSKPVDTPNGFTVRIAVGDRVLPVYTWNLEIVDQDSLNTSV